MASGSCRILYGRSRRARINSGSLSRSQKVWEVLLTWLGVC